MVGCKCEQHHCEWREELVRGTTAKMRKGSKGERKIKHKEN
jgi:hypothetical protein